MCVRVSVRDGGGSVRGVRGVRVGFVRGACDVRAGFCDDWWWWC